MATGNKKTKKAVSAKKGGDKEIKTKDDIKSGSETLVNIIDIRLKCMKLVMKHGTQNDIDNPNEKADKIFSWVMNKEKEDYSDL